MTIQLNPGDASERTAAPTLRLWNLEGAAEPGWDDEEWCICAASPEDAEAVWREAGHEGEVRSIEGLPSEQVIDLCAGDDPFDGLPEGAVVARRDTRGEPYEVTATAAAWSAFLGRGVVIDPNY